MKQSENIKNKLKQTSFLHINLGNQPHLAEVCRRGREGLAWKTESCGFAPFLGNPLSLRVRRRGLHSNCLSPSAGRRIAKQSGKRLAAAWRRDQREADGDVEADPLIQGSPSNNQLIWHVAAVAVAQKFAYA